MPPDHSISPVSRNWFIAFALFTGLSLGLGIVLYQPLLFALPAVFLLFFQTIVDFRQVFFLLLACIPISIEFYLPNGLGTDLPTEPLIVGLMMVYFLFAASQVRHFEGNFIRHPLILFLLLHLSWMLVSTINSGVPVVSIKFFVAKIWYVVVFVFLAGLILKDEKNVRKFFWWVFIPLLIAVSVTFIRQVLNGFAFEEVHDSMKPVFRNHVAYASILSLFFPFVLLGTSWFEKNTKGRVLLSAAAIFFLVAIYFSYTRAAYIAVAISLGGYLIIRLRLMKYTLALALIPVLIGIIYFAKHNNYLEYAPDYEKTITHFEFDDLLEATYNLEDISTMERAYRWVAAAFMVKDRPLVGFGPGNFYNFYHGYTVKSFETYVSDNPEQSGIHSYYLMTTVDQGIPGLLFYIILVFGVLIIGEKIYHETESKSRRVIIMMVLMSTIVIDAFQLINDLLETDKTGPFFFMNIAILVNMDLLNRKEKALKASETIADLQKG